MKYEILTLIVYVFMLLMIYTYAFNLALGYFWLSGICLLLFAIFQYFFIKRIKFNKE